MKKRVIFAASLAFVASGFHAVVPESVKTDAGLLSGTSAAAPGVRVFKGIPFAAPPVGALRWRAPQPVAKWTGVRHADKFGNGGNVAFAVISPLAHNAVYAEVFDHYSLLRTLEDGFGIGTYVGNANLASPMAPIWNP